MQVEKKTKKQLIEELENLRRKVVELEKVKIDSTQAEEAQRQSEHRYQLLFNHLLDGFAYCKMLFDDHARPIDFVYLEVNNAFVELTGLEGVVGKKVTEVIPGIKASNPEVFEIYGRVASTGNPEKFEFYLKSLKVWLFVSVYSTEIGHFVAVFENINERKQAEEALQEQLYFLQQLLNALPIPVFYKDSQGIYRGCNEAFEKLLGLSKEQVVGKTVYDVSPQDLADIYYQADEELFQHPGVQVYETSFQHADGSRHEIIYNKATYVRPDGQVAGLIGAIFDITERKQMEQRLLELATHDTLTGLPNRTLLYDRLSMALANAQRNKKKAAVMSLDLDRFKSINDTMGHAMGDRLLIDAANRLTDVLRKSDTVARIGGDEFILLLGDLDGKDDAVIVIQKILEDFRKPFEINEHRLNVTVSIGLAIFPEDGEDIEDLLKASDQALYRAKGSGRDRFAH